MARISELHYSNNFAASSGISEFAEVALSPTEDPADYVVGFYNSDGSLILEVALTDPAVQVTFDSASNEFVYTLSSDDFAFLLTDPDGGGPTNAEATALTNTTTGTVLDFYDIGGGTTNITALSGAAAGATSTNIAVPTTPNAATYSIQFNQPDPTTPAFEPITQGGSGVICFATGTMIDTPDGPRPVEALGPGDLVLTRDHGVQPLRWAGARQVRALGDMAPVVLRAGVLGARRDTVLSPQHRVLITGWQAEMLFARDEVLVPAAALVNGDTIYRRSGGWVGYHHLLFDRHELVRSNGLWSESFHPGPVGLSALEQDTRAELLALFPELDPVSSGAPVLVRPALSVAEARVLASALH